MGIRRIVRYSFTPSVYSTYSYGDLGDSSSTTQPSDSSSSSYAEYAATAASVAKTLMGEDDVRMNAAELRAKLAVARQSLASGAPPPVTAVLTGNFSGATYWSQQVTKLEAQLSAANQIADEAAYEAQINQARNLAYTAASAVGVLVLGGLALTFIQKARIQQAELTRMRQGL